jgi:hypothetical protein
MHLRGLWRDWRFRVSSLDVECQPLPHADISLVLFTNLFNFEQVGRGPLWSSEILRNDAVVKSG